MYRCVALFPKIISPAIQKQVKRMSESKMQLRVYFFLNRCAINSPTIYTDNYRSRDPFVKVVLSRRMVKGGEEWHIYIYVFGQQNRMA
ncbi:hypothetical protein PUN28_005864 [Cardiocondyla obscurior]|uniref:Uncharacterized protein n=1 Tax=Cardiocondyla obscurior TaxID=286306 RepID=A0AAW2G7P6_9HYME